MVKIGFSGTQRGMTNPQILSLAMWLDQWSSFELHIGDCVGADTQAHRIVGLLKIKMNVAHRTVGHPPDNLIKRARLQYDEEREPKPYLVRNTNIVTETERLVATPGEAYEVVRSGTWSTIRRARAANKPHTIIWPDGRVEEFA